MVYVGYTTLSPANQLLEAAVKAANRIAYMQEGHRATCILTSYALNNVLRLEGFNSKVVRITARIFPVIHEHRGVILGDPRPQKASGPDMWVGHAAVLVNDQLLLDATLDQANTDTVEVYPAIVEIDPSFWHGNSGYRPYRIGNCDVQFYQFRHQKGFASTWDATPSAWARLSHSIREAIHAN